MFWFICLVFNCFYGIVPCLNEQIYEMRNAGAVIHSHAMEACLITMIRPMSKDFQVMICLIHFTIYRLLLLKLSFYMTVRGE